MNLIAPLRVVASAVLGLVAGAVFGLVARGWMRLVSADPEFSWSGTVFIIGAFVLWGFAQGLVMGVRRVTPTRWVATTSLDVDRGSNRRDDCSAVADHRDRPWLICHWTPTCLS